MHHMSRDRVKAMALFIGFLFASLCMWCIATAAGFRIAINFSPSMPLGLYAFSRPPARINRGSIVTACLPVAAAALAHARGYLPHGECAFGTAPIVKVVLAIPGDVVVVSPTGFRVNGRRLPNAAILARDYYGRSLPHVPFGRYLLGPGRLWLWTPAPRSWDSRYYGSIATGMLLGTGRLFLPFSSWPYAAQLQAVTAAKNF